MSAILVLTPPAFAHPESAPELVNRYITVAAHEAQLEVSMARLYGQGPAADLRRRADGDGDGQISDLELQQLEQQLHREAGSWVKVRFNGVEIRPQVRLSVDLGGQRDTGRHALVVEGRLALPGTNTEVDLELTPGAPPPRHGETEVMAVLGSGWDLVTSRGPGGAKAYLHKNPTDAVAFVLRRQVAARPVRWTRQLLVAVVLAALIVGLFYWSRRSR